MRRNLRGRLVQSICFRLQTFSQKAEGRRFESVNAHYKTESYEEIREAFFISYIFSAVRINALLEEKELGFYFSFIQTFSFCSITQEKELILQSDNYLRKRMELDVLTAISPIDGRYRGKTKALAAYFSEFALIKYRVQVEVEYFITLCELPLPQLKGIDSNVYETLRNIYRNFSEADAQRIKDIESVTNHDVKAVEYFLKEEFDKMGGMDDYKEFIHFGLTSLRILTIRLFLFLSKRHWSGFITR